MSEVWRIVLTASITIAGGVIVYVLGRLCVALFVEPIHRLRTLIGEIADSLVFYAPVYGNPGFVRKEVADEAGETLRRQASQLRARAYSLPWYSFWVALGLVREKTKIQEASTELIGLSNSCHGGAGVSVAQNIKKERRVRELLGIQSNKKRKQGQTINWHAMSDGALFFIFGLLLFAVKQPSETSPWELIPFFNAVPAPPISFSVALRITLILISLILMAVVFQIWRKWRFNRVVFVIIFFLLLLFALWLIPPLPVWFFVAFGLISLLLSLAFMVAVFCKRLADRLETFVKAQYIYGIIFWFVYTLGWLTGISNIPADRWVFHVAFWFGFMWFLFIPIAWYKFIFQQGK